MSFTSICGVFMRYKTSCYKRQYSKSMNSQTDHRTRSMFTQRYICSGLKTQILTVSFFAILIITYWFAISFKETTKLLFYDLSRLLLYRIQIAVIFLMYFLWIYQSYYIRLPFLIFMPPKFLILVYYNLKLISSVLCVSHELDLIMKHYGQKVS